MKKRIGEVVILFLLAGIALFWGWNQYASECGKQLEIIYVSKVSEDTNAFWSALMAGARMAAAEQNVKLTIVGPETEQDYEQQNEKILWAIQQKPAAIMLSACDYSRTLEAARQVKESGIPLVFVDSNVEEEIEDCLVATDNYAAGVKIGELAQQSLHEESQILLVGHVKNSSTAIARLEGITYALGDAAGQIAEVVYCDSDAEKAKELTRQALLENSGINMVIAMSEDASVGAARAVKALGYEDKVTLLGFDNSVEQVRFLEEGVLNGLVVQKSFNMGYLALEQAAAIARGETYQKYIDSGSESITQENMQEPENQALLFPFIPKQY